MIDKHRLSRSRLNFVAACSFAIFSPPDRLCFNYIKLKVLNQGHFENFFFHLFYNGRLHYNGNERSELDGHMWRATKRVA
jgi:hypothetical protein